MRSGYPKVSSLEPLFQFPFLKKFHFHFFLVLLLKYDKNNFFILFFIFFFFFLCERVISKSKYPVSRSIWLDLYVNLRERFSGLWDKILRATKKKNRILGSSLRRNVEEIKVFYKRK